MPATPTPESTATPSPTATAQPSPTATPPACVGDCDGNGVVTIDEIVRAVNIDLGALPLAVCAAADGDGRGVVTIDEVVHAVANALDGCPSVGSGQH